ncbi:hypothetical protein [Microbacterium sp. KR10-403]|uniref:hypothetical protein n=1 Tax=Microbacterium sp. KR10-403 TaxID=3158581 RepID=UPI0032E46447
MTTTTAPADPIAAFAAAVRTELRDLPADEVDDIVDGLESDLAEQAAEHGDGFELPDAAAYAAELRQAAGLPERPSGMTARQALGAQLRSIGDRTVRGIRSSRIGSGLLDFAVALRPIWWIARGWMLYVLVLLVLRVFLGLSVDVPIPMSGAAIAILVVMVVVSIQWGRGRWRPWAWTRVGLIVVSTVTAVMLPFVIGIAIGQVQSWQRDASAGYVYDQAPPGLAVDGQRVRNIFAYDADGNPLTDVQLFDQNGNPLTTVGGQDPTSPVDEYFAWGGGPVPVGVSQPGRTPVWNIFPLEEIPAGLDDGDPTLAQAATPPFAQVPSLQRLLAASPTPSPEPTEGSSPEPTPEPTPGATEGAPTPTAVPDGDAHGERTGVDAATGAATDDEGSR